MEWINRSSSTVQEKQQQQEENGMTVEGLYAKVMTDEQMELLRKQIAVYAMICEQLVDMHKSFSAQYDTAVLMEWNSSSISLQENVLMVEELYVKVMTEEQMELLRKQIAVYAMISEQLVEMHNSLSAQYDIAGMRLGNPYLDPFMSSGGQKLTTRQRWTPTPMQLQILERVYDECSGNPGKQKILDMTAELAHHGQISETNVYNWFQNRRARIKRKQSGVPSNTTESEAKKHVMSKKYTTPESIQSFENPTARITENNIYFQSPNIGMEQMIGKMDVAGMVFSPPLPHWQMDRYDMFG